MKKTKTGICKICKEKRELSFEHIPPRSAYNKTTNYYSIDSTELYLNAEDFAFRKKKPKSKKEQGGMGYYCLCEDCNGFLGSKYVRDYKEFAEIAMSILQNFDQNAKGFQFEISGINLLKFLKQITSMFICRNNILFTEMYPELLAFVKDETIESLPNRYRFYMYLNNEGNNRAGMIQFLNTHGAICEFTFRPFGFVLNIDNSNQIEELSEITNFKNYNYYSQDLKLPITLNKLPTHYPFPLDYRAK